MRGKSQMNEQDRKKRRALIALEIVIFGYLLIMFLIQLRLYAQRNW